MQPNGVPPIGTTTATSIGRDYTLGATRSLESDAGRAERMARRYIRKFGRAGQQAASELLKVAAFQRAGGASVLTQAGAAARMEQRKKAEQDALAQGAAADQIQAAATSGNPTGTGGGQSDTEESARGTLTSGATPGVGRRRPVGSEPTEPTAPSGLAYLRNPTEVEARIKESRQGAMKRKGLFGSVLDQVKDIA